MKAIARGWRRRPWAQALLFALAVGQAGCSCLVPDLDLPPPRGCVFGVMCPDGSCVAGLVPNPEGICCGFGGECEPCPFGGFECPDGTCAASSEACCAHGGSCEPGDDGPHRQPGSTGGESEGGSEGGSSEGGASEGTSEGASSDTGDASTTTGGETAASSGSTG